MPTLPSPRTLLASSLVALVIVPACEGPAPDPGPGKEAPGPAGASPRPDSAQAPPAGPSTYTLEGVVRLTDRDDGVVSIDHEEIPGLMPAMLMDFRLEDPSLLDDVVVDDEVVGTLEVDRDGSGRVIRMEMVDLVVSRPAPPRPATAPSALPPLLPELMPGQPVPDFEMTTQDGESMRLSDLRGKVVVLTFIFTRCPQPEFCPLMDRKFGTLAARVSRSPDRAGRVRLLSVSFDPEHDTPGVLAEHARRVGAGPPLWTFAVASHEELAKVAQPLGLSYAPMTDQIRHTLSTAVIAPDGTLSRLEKGNGWGAGDLDGEIRSLLGDPGDSPAKLNK
ncbi:hypothetical protein ElP_64250 [Tautonia plasticadhaerens]|uniref:Thioredoxin domain-containing protein n=2 Tax=Tautonia plasticadhaerens TaxID=2527974 RepID=A0A518HC99_9BACT|nr:hypothetical protein ElP_64250 [Tautonia plasticadhaerens]